MYQYTSDTRYVKFSALELDLEIVKNFELTKRCRYFFDGVNI